MKRIFLLSMALTGCFDDSGGGSDGDGISATGDDADSTGADTSASDGDGGSSESSNDNNSSDTGGTSGGGLTSADTTNMSGSTSSETANGIPLDGICDPLDLTTPCAGGLTCSLYEWDPFDNVYRFHCKEYTGYPNGGQYGDPIMNNAWGDCKSGFAPLNNINGDNFPDSICLGMGTCCTAICSSLNTTCPSGTICGLFIEPMDMNFYIPDKYGTCRK